MSEISQMPPHLQQKIDLAIQKKIKLTKQDLKDIIQHASNEDIKEILNAIGNRFFKEKSL